MIVVYGKQRRVVEAAFQLILVPLQPGHLIGGQFMQIIGTELHVHSHWQAGSRGRPSPGSPVPRSLSANVPHAIPSQRLCHPEKSTNADIYHVVNKSAKLALADWSRIGCS